MSNILLALLPVFLLIFLGWGIRKRELLPQAFWPGAEKLTYYVTFPALLIINLSQANFSNFAALPLAGTVGGATVGTAALIIASRRLWGRDGPAFTSYFQGAIRANSYVGIAVGTVLYGEAGLTMVAILLGLTIPLVNLLSVSVLVTYIPEDRLSMGAFIKPIATNPLILACATGLLININGIGLPLLLEGTLEILGKASLPLGLLAVGAGLTVRGLGTTSSKIALNSSIKLLLLPLLALGVARMIGLPPMETGMAVLYCGLPCAPSAYILASQMNGDAPLMAKIITVQTLAAMISLTALAYLV